MGPHLLIGREVDLHVGPVRDPELQGRVGEHVGVGHHPPAAVISGAEQVGLELEMTLVDGAGQGRLGRAGRRRRRAAWACPSEWSPQTRARRRLGERLGWADRPRRVRGRGRPGSPRPGGAGETAQRKLGPLRSRPIRTPKNARQKVDGQRHHDGVEGEGEQAVHRPDPTQGPGVEGDVGGLGGDADDDAEVQEIPVVRLAALRELQAAADRRGRLGLRGGIVFVGVVDGEDQLDHEPGGRECGEG